MIYYISHRTTTTYAWKVTLSQHLLHLAPRPCPRQTILHHSLISEPAPTLARSGQDFFGNPTTYLTIQTPHDQLTIIASSKIDVRPADYPSPESTMPWDQVTPILAQRTDPEILDAYQYVFDSPFTGSDRAENFAQASFPAGRPILEGAVDLMSRIHREFKYEGGITDIYTPVDSVLANRRGVCQDFAHLQISCLRALGLPARYVSGYLRTRPPPGQEKRVGADASHAWLAIWIPGHGWVDLDPTNNLMVSDEHITLAWGRDYGDVSPINGMVLGGGEQKIDVTVDVRPTES